jgi:hypothetical protein
MKSFFGELVYIPKPWAHNLSTFRVLHFEELKQTEKKRIVDE